MRFFLQWSVRVWSLAVVVVAAVAVAAVELKPFDCSMDVTTTTTTATTIDGRTLYMQDIPAPVPVVWDQLLDLDQYANHIDLISQSERRPIRIKTNDSKPKRKKQQQSEQEMYASIQIKAFYSMIHYDFQLKYSYEKEKNCMTWTSSSSSSGSSSSSDGDSNALHHIVGYWKVIPLNNNDTHSQGSRVFHAVEIASSSGFVNQVITDRYVSRKLATQTMTWLQGLSAFNNSITNAAPKSRKSKFFFSGKKSSIHHQSNHLPSQQEQSPKSVLDDDDSNHAMECVVDAASGERVCQSSFDNKENGESKIGFKRYVLVSSVLALSVYNVHLFLSR